MGVSMGGSGGKWSSNVNGIHYTAGKVGIGIDLPDQPLEVYSTELGYMCSFRYFVNHASGAVLRMYKARGTIAAPRRAKSGDTLGGFNIFGYEAVDDATDAVSGTVGFQFQAKATETYTSTTKGSSFILNLTPTGTVGVVLRLLIYNDGTLTHFNIPGLPTSAVGLNTGDIWVDTAAGNVLKIV